MVQKNLNYFEKSKLLALFQTVGIPTASLKLLLPRNINTKWANFLHFFEYFVLDSSEQTDNLIFSKKAPLAVQMRSQHRNGGSRFGRTDVDDTKIILKIKTKDITTMVKK